MKKFKYILFSTIIIFILNFPAHFLFDFWPLKFIGYFFPVNESIFQHLKMMFTCFMLFYIFLFFFKKSLALENITLSALVSSLSTIIIFLLIYLPITAIFKENMIVTFIILFLSIFLGQYLGNKILRKKDYKYLNYLSLFIILIILIFNASLTYNPLKNYLFYDALHKTFDIVIKRH